MVLATVIKKIKRDDKRTRFFSRRFPRLGGGLTLQILSVNLIAPVVLVIGFLYLGQYRDSLIAAELRTLTLQAQLFAGAIAEGAVRPVQRGKPLFFAKPEEIEVLVPELSRRMLRRFGETMDTRTRLFDSKGILIGDSENLARFRSTRVGQVMGPHRPTMIDQLKRKAEWVLDLVPSQTILPRYQETASNQIGDYPDAALALKGTIAATAWQDAEGRIILTASAPVVKSRQVLGVIMLSHEGQEIRAAVDQMRFDILTVFMGALSITIFLSMYLAGVIGQPLRKLARAAEAVRTGQGRQIDIPDLTHRKDEIGELSAALRDMTTGLRDRMDTIERFAADVAHEIKNPLTSLRSAVETAAIVKDRPDDLDRLMKIMQHDVTRLDRLISDISNASRLDAELSREEMGIVNLHTLLSRLVEGRMVALDHHRAEGDARRIELDIPENIGTVLVHGNDHRLAQVFDNLFTNALSFSPPDGVVRVAVIPGPDRSRISVTVSDQGPGIPEAKLEAIFDRFYTERPKHEDYGSHSGLGLSIARQIVQAHHGVIFAENIYDDKDTKQVRGARFTVTLNRI
jgi:two-component system sensor histidine kinase ChvG